MAAVEKVSVTLPELRRKDIERLRLTWDAGIASGLAGELDMKKLRRDARERLERAKKAVDGE